uniref:Uncharacterized protein n=1 Tax=Schistocephalus solidus TaxID=70667 RepID=A0A0X3PI03_SCHSO
MSTYVNAELDLLNSPPSTTITTEKQSEHNLHQEKLETTATIIIVAHGGQTIVPKSVKTDLCVEESGKTLSSENPTSTQPQQIQTYHFNDTPFHLIVVLSPTVYSSNPTTCCATGDRGGCIWSHWSPGRTSHQTLITDWLTTMKMMTGPFIDCFAFSSSTPGGRAAALRASILDLIALLMQGLNSSALTGAVNGGLAFELQERVVDIVGKDLTLNSSLSAAGTTNTRDDDDEDVDGSADTLFEPSLRLWHSLVSGPGSAWSAGLDRLLPVLTGTSAMMTAEAATNHRSSFDNPLYTRLESSEQARLYFDIAQGCLRLATSGVQSPCDFLHRWTEPFWAPALAEAVTHNQMRADCVAAKLSPNQAPTDTTESDEESTLVVQQLTLLLQWLSRLLVLTPEAPIPPSPCGLLLLHSNACLTRAPVEVHDDVAFKANRARLLLLAQLACFPERRLFLTRLLTLSYTNPGDLNFTNACLELSATPLSSSTIDTADASAGLFQPLLTRILTRSDCLTDYRARRCFIVAAFVCLVHMVNPRHYLAGATASDNTQASLETLLASDAVHATWLEPIINLAVQVLCEGDQQVTATFAVDEGDCGLWLPPPTVASLEGSRGLLRSLLHFWQERVGGDIVASEILAAHVDPAILEQFHRQLNQPPTTTLLA